MSHLLLGHTVWQDTISETLLLGHTVEQDPIWKGSLLLRHTVSWRKKSNLSVLEDSDTGVGCAQIDSDGNLLRHDVFGVVYHVYTNCSAEETRVTNGVLSAWKLLKEGGIAESRDWRDLCRPVLSFSGPAGTVHHWRKILKNTKFYHHTQKFKFISPLKYKI